MTVREGPAELRVRLSVADVETARNVISALEETDATVETDDLAVDRPREVELAQIDVGRITPKQWEALELAYDSGYYSRPRETDLQELADEFDISKSAVSQRLRSAEKRLVDALLTAVRT